MAPKVTIIVPVFNGQQFLPQAMASVFAQVRGDWHLILIDDASSDGSSELLKPYSDSRIILRLHNDRNIGLYGSLNKAISHVATEWVAILHQDDELYSTYLEELLGLVTRYPQVDAVWAEQDIIDKEGRFIAKRKDTGRIELIDPGKQPWLSGLQRGCYWIGSGSLTRTRLLTADRFRTDLPHCGDYQWFLRAIRTSRFLYYEKPLVRLRQHAGQASASNLVSGRDIREAYCVIEENIARHGHEISSREAVAIARNWMMVIGRRAAAAVVRGRWLYAGRLAGCALRLLFLPLQVAKRSRGE